MKRGTLFVAVLAALILVVGLTWFLWPRNVSRPLLRLKVVRQTVEQGKSVVFFRIEVADRRRIQITGAERVVSDVAESSWQGERDSRGFPLVTVGFWAPSQGSPTGDP